VGSLLEMLVVLHAAPVAAPAKAKRGKDLLAEVILVDFVREVFASVHIISCS